MQARKAKLPPMTAFDRISFAAVLQARGASVIELIAIGAVVTFARC